MKPGSFGIWLIAEKCDLSTGGWEGPRTRFCGSGHKTRKFRIGVWQREWPQFYRAC